MTELTQRDFVATRMGEAGSGISYAEFSYSLLQGYDFWWLFKNKGTVLQIGASDQWGNMLSGVPLIRKKEGKEAHAMSMPLVVDKTTGRKFGKSEAGAIWLDPKLTSPTQFYQFWINASDAEVADFLKIYTLLPVEKIQEVMEYHASHPEERKAQTLLAEQVTELVHGKEETHTAALVTEVLTGAKSVSEVSEGVVAEVRKEIPHVELPENAPILTALVASGIVGSNSEARRLLNGGAIYVNGETVKDEKFVVRDAKTGKFMVRRGKAFKDSALIEVKQG